jgi:hypothetical protein
MVDGADVPLGDQGQVRVVGPLEKLWARVDALEAEVRELRALVTPLDRGSLPCATQGPDCQCWRCRRQRVAARVFDNAFKLRESLGAQSVTDMPVLDIERVPLSREGLDVVMQLTRDISRAREALGIQSVTDMQRGHTRGHVWDGPSVPLSHGDVPSCSLCGDDASTDRDCPKTEPAPVAPCADESRRQPDSLIYDPVTRTFE